MSNRIRIVKIGAKTSGITTLGQMTGCKPLQKDHDNLIWWLPLGLGVVVLKVVVLKMAFFSVKYNLTSAAS
jgi:hypothetical protein